MRTIPLHLPGADDDRSIVRAIEGACAAAGLVVAMKGTLRTHPGSIHWHFKKGARRGTLEATYSPRERQAWLSVHSGRDADWIDEALSAILRAMDHN